MSDSDLQRILTELRQKAERMGKDSSIWTSRRVAAYIDKNYGVKYHWGNMWRRMSKLGWQFKRGPRFQANRTNPAKKTGSAKAVR